MYSNTTRKLADLAVIVISVAMTTAGCKKENQRISAADHVEHETGLNVQEPPILKGATIEIKSTRESAALRMKMSPCELFARTPGTPMLYKVGQMKSVKPSGSALPSVVTLARLDRHNGAAASNRSVWIAFAGGAVTQDIRTSASVGLRVGEEIALIKNPSMWRPSLKAYWVDGREVMHMSGDTFKSVLGKFDVPNVASSQTPEKILGAFVNKHRGGSQCQVAWVNQSPQPAGAAVGTSGSAASTIIHLPEATKKAAPTPTTNSANE